MFGKIVSTFVAGLALASAYTTPVGSPTGNSILTPGSTSIVPVGTPYQITWTPTTSGTITLLLLRGPAENIKYLSTIVEGTQNTGSYSWTPSTDLDDDTTHYGIQLIVDATGQYQYSTQFGVSNPNKKAASSSSMIMSTTVISSSTPASSMPASVSSSMSMSSAPVVNVTSASVSQSTSYGVSTITSGSSTIVTSSVARITSTTIAVVSPSAGSTTTSARSSSASIVQSNDAGRKAVLSFGGVAAMAIAAVAAY